MERPLGLRKGTWCKQEDDLLKACIQRYGEGKWHLVPQRAGLNRCRKSCRLRWMNYLKPDIKRGNFTDDEVDMIMRFHKLLGNRWSLIAARFPGRTSNDLKNYWNTYMRKKHSSQKEEKNEKHETIMETHEVIKPQPLTFSRNSAWLRGKSVIAVNNDNINSANQHTSKQPCPVSPKLSENSREWWENLLDDKEGDEGNSSWCLGEEGGTFSLTPVIRNSVYHAL